MNFREYAEPVGQHSSLNPKLWDHDVLKSSVRGALMRIAEDFLDFVEVPVQVLDIVIAGGNANYTYTSHSDIDLHIIADYSQTPCDREAAELFDTKRLLYKHTLDLDIAGIPVELYIEDHRHPAVSASYSILKDQWITPPQKDIPEYDEKLLEHWVNIWKTVLQHAVKTGSLETCRHALGLLRNYRKLGLKTADGEFSTPNLVYKSLRNDSTLAGITHFINRLHSQDLSI
jgi:hypothetical protein